MTEIRHNLLAIQADIATSLEEEVDILSPQCVEAIIQSPFCDDYVACLAELFATLNIQATSRAYRQAYSESYRQDFPETSMLFQTEVLIGSIYPSVTLNGGTRRMSSKTLERANDLQLAFVKIWEFNEEYKPHQEEMDAELVKRLVHLDVTWARFEESYMTELFRLEGEGLGLVEQAIESEGRLTAAETAADREEHGRAQQQLVHDISRLNAAVSLTRKGTESFTVSILTTAEALVARAAHAEVISSHPARALARDVVASFNQMRSYLRYVAAVFHEVDPNLRSNRGLVERLEDYERSWSLASKFLIQQPLLDAIVQLANELQLVGQHVAGVHKLQENLDKDFYFAVPRLIWIFYFVEPSRQSSLILKFLLPERFSGTSDAEDPMLAEVWQRFAEFKAFVKDYKDSDAFKLLAYHAVYGRSAPGLPESSRLTEATLMRDIQVLALMLQRDRQSDWNDVCCVLQDVLTEEKDV